CDVLVVGGGSAGVDYTLSASGANKRVIVVEQGDSVGGDVERLEPLPNVQLFRRTMAVAYYDHDLVAMVESVEGEGLDVPRERLWLVRARKVVLATGAIEQPLIFSNND